MIKIATSDLKEYLNRSGKIKHNNILPILSYDKLECDGNEATITRTNNNSFVVHQLKVKCKKKITVLLDRKVLSSYVDQTNAKEITIELEDKKVLLYDGSLKQRFELMDHTHFPTIPDHDQTKSISISQEVLESLLISKNNTDAKQGNPFFHYAHIFSANGKKASYVFGTNAIVIYYKNFAEKLPCISLDENTVSIISGYESLMYSESGNYDFFDAGNTLYAFIKPDFTVNDISTVISGRDEKMQFVMNKKDVVSYCQYIRSINPSALAYVYFADAGKKSIIMRYANVDHNLDADKFFDVEKNSTIRDFCFNPNHMISLIKDLPYDDLRFSICDNHNCYITADDDKDFVGVIREILFQ